MSFRSSRKRHYEQERWGMHDDRLDRDYICERSHSPKRRSRSPIHDRGHRISKDPHRSRERRRSRTRSRSRSISPRRTSWERELVPTWGARNETSSVVSTTKEQKNYSDPRGEIADTKCILMRGLKTITTEETIADHVKVYGIVRDVRLIRDKVSGESRGFAFVDFSTPEEASSFLNHTNGVITIDGVTVQLDYSREKVSRSGESQDWFCGVCHGNNFGRRRSCYLCQSPKPENPELVSSIDNTPCSVLVIRGLDVSTNEQKLRDMFCQYGSVKEIRLIRDKTTQLSRGFAFIEFLNIEDAKRAYEGLKNQRIDGKLIKISYTHRTPQNNDSSAVAVEQAQWSSQQTSSIADPEKILAIINSDQLPLYTNFVYDQSSGYYHDSKTGLYYETTNNYYWDGNNGVFYIFNPNLQQYVKQEGSYQPQRDPSEKKIDQSDQPSDLQKDINIKPKKKIAKTVRSKKIDRELKKWNTKSKELKEEISQESDFSVESHSLNEESENVPKSDVGFDQSILCLLCKRKFSTQEALKKHEEFSELHKHNLEMAAVKQHQQFKDSVRNLEEAKRELDQGQQASEGGLTENNVGSQILQKMGWKQGQGIGKNAVLSAPIEVELRTERAGLGLNDSLASMAKKRSKSRSNK